MCSLIAAAIARHSLGGLEGLILFGMQHWNEDPMLGPSVLFYTPNRTTGSYWMSVMSVCSARAARLDDLEAATAVDGRTDRDVAPGHSESHWQGAHSHHLHANLVSTATLRLPGPVVLERCAARKPIGGTWCCLGVQNMTCGPLPWQPYTGPLFQ
jgi:hypothetical protein